MGHIVFKPEDSDDWQNSDFGSMQLESADEEELTTEETRIKELEDKVEKLEARLARLENMVRRTWRT